MTTTPDRPRPTAEPADTGLRAARSARGWSQTDAARQLVALARERGVPVAAAASLKTQLSRWENGHALPDPPYRELLGELYGRAVEELGLVPRSPSGPEAPVAGAARLRAALAGAAAATGAGAQLWWEQLDAAARLDDELGAAGAGPLVDAQIERLSEVVVHALDPGPRTELAAVLAAATALGAAQSLDRGRPDLAWHRFDSSLVAARRAGSPAAAAVAVAGQAEVLVDIGDPGAAVALLGRSGAGPDGAAAVRLAAAGALAAAATGDRAAATRALDEAERRWSDVEVDQVVPPPWLRVRLADLDRWRGHALAELGDAAAAEPLDRALRAGQHAARHRAAVHADLARVLSERRPEAAAGHAAAARELAAGIGSERVAGWLSRPLTGGRPS